MALMNSSSDRLPLPWEDGSGISQDDGPKRKREKREDKIKQDVQFSRNQEFLGKLSNATKCKGSPSKICMGENLGSLL